MPDDIINKIPAMRMLNVIAAMWYDLSESDRGPHDDGPQRRNENMLVDHATALDMSTTEVTTS